MSDETKTATPRTDNAEVYYDGRTGFVPVETSRQLERDLAEAKFAIDQHGLVCAELGITTTPDGPDDTPIEAACRLKEQLAEARDEVAEVKKKSAMALANEYVNIMHKERDEANRKLEVAVEALKIMERRDISDPACWYRADAALALREIGATE